MISDNKNVLPDKLDLDNGYIAKKFNITECKQCKTGELHRCVEFYKPRLSDDYSYKHFVVLKKGERTLPVLSLLYVWRKSNAKASRFFLLNELSAAGKMRGIHHDDLNNSVQMFRTKVDDIEDRVSITSCYFNGPFQKSLKIFCEKIFKQEAMRKVTHNIEWISVREKYIMSLMDYWSEQIEVSEVFSESNRNFAFHLGKEFRTKESKEGLIRYLYGVVREYTKKQREPLDRFKRMRFILSADLNDQDEKDLRPNTKGKLFCLLALILAELDSHGSVFYSERDIIPKPKKIFDALQYFTSNDKPFNDLCKLMNADKKVKDSCRKVLEHCFFAKDKKLVNINNNNVSSAVEFHNLL